MKNCLDCEKLIESKTRCIECAKKQNTRAKKYRDKQILNKKCLYCKISLIDNFKKCLQCRINEQNRSKKIRRQARIINNCGACLKDKAIIGKLCEICWYKRKAGDHLKNPQQWSLLKQLIESQNFTCAYTGIIIKPGINASLDHKIPPRKDGTFTIDNVQWTDITINYVKRNLTHQEFIDLCKLISIRF